MAITADPSKATMVLLADAGWQAIQLGSLTFDSLVLIPETPTPESEDYGFTYIADTGNERVTGRVSALLAIRGRF